MLKYNLLIALRNFKKDKTTFAINLIGLTAGLVVAISIFSWVLYELSYDNFHAKSDQIYRIINERFQNGEMVQKGTITYPTIGPTMQKDFPEVVNTTRIFYQGQMTFTKADKIIRVEEVHFVDHRFFELFDFELLAGDRNTALTKTNQLVLTETIAQKLFNISDKNYDALIGESVIIGRNEDPCEVIGVIADLPANSIFQSEVLGSYPTLVRYMGERVENSWDWSDFYHFIELAEGTDVAALEAKFPAFSKKYFKERTETESVEKFYLQPLSQAHLYSSGLEYEIMRTGNARAVWSLLAIAFLILLIAWMNYVNLSSVKAIERAREVGLRRVIGAGKGQITRQFLTEALLINAIALFAAIPLSRLFQPWFFNIMGADPKTTLATPAGSTEYLLYGGCITLMFLAILLSGLYPSWLLSSKNTPEVLKGKFRNTKESQLFRKSLVIGQFTISVGLIIVTIFAYQQVKFMNEKDIGLNVDQIMVFNGPELTRWDSLFIHKMNTFTAELRQFPNIKNASTSSRVPGDGMARIFGLTVKGDESNKGYMCNVFDADAQYDDTYGLQTLAGRFFRPEDSNYNGRLVNNIVINETARKRLGFIDNDECLGQQLHFYERDFNIVGVVNDFHQMSVHHPIEPLVIIPYYATGSPISVRLSPQNIDQTIAQIQNTYHNFFPGNAFEYRFLDSQFAQLYAADKNFSRMLLFFTVLAIFVACLGLFGLASYIAHLRTKEIGVRKVLGSSVGEIVALLSKDFLKLVLIAVLLAAPLAWYCTKAWLQGYEYRIPIQWAVFIFSGVVALAIAFLTIGFQSFRAALANPVESLKTE